MYMYEKQAGSFRFPRTKNEQQLCKKLALQSHSYTFCIICGSEQLKHILCEFFNLRIPPPPPPGYPNPDRRHSGQVWKPNTVHSLELAGMVNFNVTVPALLTTMQRGSLFLLQEREEIGTRGRKSEEARWAVGAVFSY